MNRFIVNNMPRFKVLRTIVQAIIGILLVNGGAYVMEIMAHVPVADWLKPILVAIIMAILAGVMPYLESSDMDKPELDHDHWEGDDE